MDIFAIACDLDDDARAECVARECGSDGHLRGLVERLLLADGESKDPLEFARADLPPREGNQSLLGTLPRIEGFRLIRRVGVGGMGCVYEARQLSPPRDVAIKTLRAGLHTPDS